MATLISRFITNCGRLSLKNIHNVNKSFLCFNPLASLSRKCYSTEPTPYEIVDDKKENTLVNGMIINIYNLLGYHLLLLTTLLYLYKHAIL